MGRGSGPWNYNFEGSRRCRLTSNFQWFWGPHVRIHKWIFLSLQNYFPQWHNHATEGYLITGKNRQPILSGQEGHAQKTQHVLCTGLKPPASKCCSGRSVSWPRAPLRDILFSHLQGCFISQAWLYTNVKQRKKFCSSLSIISAP